MANPIYHDDPEWYERPGETVHLEVDQHGLSVTVPELPWMPGTSMADRTRWRLLCRDMVLRMDGTGRCAVCRKDRVIGPTDLCAYCARAQMRDETAKARANQPQPSRARISVREGWETWAAAQPHDTEDLASGHVREYETRIG